MTGRARGRARGRSRGQTQPQARRPGEPGAPSTEASQPQVGRGRGRAAAAAPQQVQKQQPPPQPAAQQPPTEQMAKMKVTSGPAERHPPATTTTAGRGGRGRSFTEMHTKPEHVVDKRGTTKSQDIRVTSNYVVLRSRPNTALYQYHVKYEPNLEYKKLRIGLLCSQEQIIGKVKAFDGMILYLPHRLQQDVTEIQVRTKRGEDVKITITLTNELSANNPVCLQLFNIIFRRLLNNLGMEMLGRHYYSTSNPIKVPEHKLELLPGFATAIQQYERQIMLCTEVQHKILRTETVLDLLDDLHRRNPRSFTDAAVKALVGEIVLTKYNNKTYRIDDIDWNSNPQSTFKLHSGEEISFVEYYKRRYNFDIEDQRQPLLLSRPKKSEIRARGGDDSPLLLIPEYCTLTGLSEETRSNFHVMKDLGQHTRMGPDARVKTIMKFIRDLSSNPKCAAELDGWNLEFDRDLITYPARVLPTETIFQADSRYSYPPFNADWTKELRGKRIIAPVSLTDYMVVFTKRDGEKAQDFVSTLQRVGPPMGMQVGKPKMVDLPTDKTDVLIDRISRNLRADSTQLVVVVLPTNRKDRYDAVKKLLCVEYAVPSQCIMARTLSKKQTLMSVVTKVALQINCKLGGELWALEIPLKKLMVVGIDTYHDSSSRGRSVGGFIASTNPNLTKYHCQTMFQHTGQELADNLLVCMSNALRKFHELNGYLPDRIIVYRDGVGDGQLPAVMQYELPQLMASFKMVGNEYNPKFTMIVVKKRINARIMKQDRGRMDNPPPGTVVDTEITCPEWYDFFLVSQSVRQGTVSPTHFNVISDTSGLKPDHMQRLTYKLCHLYYNWPGTVRVPAPCQYAHKLAFLVGDSIHKTPDSQLADRLYFL